MDTEIKERLEYLRSQIEAEIISYGEISELQDLAAKGHIDPGDVLLLQWTGVSEFPEQDDSLDNEITVVLTVREAQALAVASDDYAESGRNAQWDEEDVAALDVGIERLRTAGSF